MAIEIHLDGKHVTKLQAARAVAVANGQSVEIGEPDASGWIRHGITVYPRRPDLDGVQPPQVHWASYTGVSAAGARVFALGAEVAELAMMIAAEQDEAERPGSLVGTIVADACDDSDCPVTGKVIGQVDEETVEVLWGDLQFFPNPGPGSVEAIDALRPVRQQAGA